MIPTGAVIEVQVLLACLALLALGSGLLVVLRAIPGRQSSRGDVVALIAWLAAWGLLLGGVLGVCLSLMGYVWGFVFFLALLVLAATTLVLRYQAQRRALLRLIATSVERDIPLGPAMRAFGQESSLFCGVQTARMAHLLESGAPPAAVLGEAYGLIPPRLRAMIRLGAETGTLVPMLREAGREPTRSDLLAAAVAHLLYFGALALFGTSIVAFMMLKVVPAFRQMFEDFGTELPKMTQALIDLSTLAGRHSWLLLPLLLCAALLFVNELVAGRAWPFSLVQRLRRPLDAAFVLRSIATVVEAGHPLVPALATLARSSSRLAVARRLERAERDIASGVPWPASLRRQALLSADEVELVRSAERAGNLPWALRMIAEAKERRFAYGLRARLEIIGPALVLLAGGVVMVIVTGLFLPLVVLIELLL